MLITATVTFWRWLTGQSMPLTPPSTTAASVEERRVWLRYATALNIRCGEIGIEADAAAEASICDISRGGIQMISARRFEPGAHLSVELPSANGEGAMAVLAYVVRA